MTTWTRESVQALGPVTDVPTLASILGVHSDTVYAQIRRGEWTATRVLALGRKIRIPTRDVIALLFDSGPVDRANPAVPTQCHHDETPQAKAAQPHTSCGCTPECGASVRPTQGA